MEEHEEEAGGPYHEAELHARAVNVAGGVGDPVRACGGTVAAEPAGKLSGIGRLEVDCEGPVEGVDGRDGRCEDGVEDCTIDIVEDLFLSQYVARLGDGYADMSCEGGVTYICSGHDPIFPR